MDLGQLGRSIIIGINPSSDILTDNPRYLLLLIAKNISNSREWVYMWFLLRGGRVGACWEIL